MRKTYKYRIYPSNQQIVKLEAMFDICRILYNSCLVDRKNHYEATGKGLSRMDQQKILTADRKRVLLLKEVHSQVLQDVLFRVERAFDGFFRRLKGKDGKAGYPRFKSVGRYDSISYPQEPGFKLEDNKLKISKIGHIKIKMHRSIIGKVKNCTIRRDGTHWYACFSTEYSPEATTPPQTAIGIDVGLKSFATLSNGQEIQNPKFFRKLESRLVRVQRSLSRKKKGSHNRSKSRKALATVHRKIRNQRNNFHHQETRKIVNSYGYIKAEDLNIKGMVRNHHLAKSISDAGWGGFLTIMAYKAEEAGCYFEKVPAHHTSINCSNCGTPVPKTLATRTHKCPVCKIELDRDHNAAINILNKNTVGTTGIHAWGEVVQSDSSMNQEAMSLAV
jgi:putative transposase